MHLLGIKSCHFSFNDCSSNCSQQSVRASFWPSKSVLVAWHPSTCGRRVKSETPGTSVKMQERFFVSGVQPPQLLRVMHTLFSPCVFPHIFRKVMPFTNFLLFESFSLVRTGNPLSDWTPAEIDSFSSPLFFLQITRPDKKRHQFKSSLRSSADKNREVLSWSGSSRASGVTFEGGGGDEKSAKSSLH